MWDGILELLKIHLMIAGWVVCLFVFVAALNIALYLAVHYLCMAEKFIVTRWHHVTGKG